MSFVNSKDLPAPKAVHRIYAKEEAGKAVGRLLYQLLYDDKRESETWVVYTRMYRWTGEEDNG